MGPFALAFFRGPTSHRFPGYVTDQQDVNSLGGTTANLGDIVLNTKFSFIPRGESGFGLVF